jgi:site-specific DNA recombinase
VLDRSHDETAELAAKVFELSQALGQKWVSADYAVKRRILEIVCLNCDLVDTSLVPTMRKPFDALAEGLISKNSRGGRTPLELFVSGVALWPRVLVVGAESLMANLAA